MARSPAMQRRRDSESHARGDRVAQYLRGSPLVLVIVRRLLRAAHHRMPTLRWFSRCRRECRWRRQWCRHRCRQRRLHRSPLDATHPRLTQPLCCCCAQQHRSVLPVGAQLIRVHHHYHHHTALCGAESRQQQSPKPHRVYTRESAPSVATPCTQLHSPKPLFPVCTPHRQVRRLSSCSCTSCPAQPSPAHAVVP